MKLALNLLTLFLLASGSPILAGGVIGNGGKEFAIRAAQHVYQILRRVDEICRLNPSLDSPACREREKVLKAYAETAWHVEWRLVLCADGNMVTFDSDAVFENEMKMNRKHYQENGCYERDSINFGRHKGRDHKYQIYISERAFKIHFEAMDHASEPKPLMHLVHELLTLVGIEESDTYHASAIWGDLIERYSKWNVILDSNYKPEPKSVAFRLPTHTDIQAKFVSWKNMIVGQLAKKGYVETLSDVLSAHLFEIHPSSQTLTLVDGSQDCTLTVRFGKLTERGELEQIAAKVFHYNTKLPQCEPPESKLIEIMAWVNSAAIPRP
jgi:hypothetical protein